MQAGPEFLLKPAQVFLNPEGDVLGMYFTEAFWHIRVNDVGLKKKTNMGSSRLVPEQQLCRSAHLTTACPITNTTSSETEHQCCTAHRWQTYYKKQASQGSVFPGAQVPPAAISSWECSQQPPPKKWWWFSRSQTEINPGSPILSHITSHVNTKRLPSFATWSPGAAGVPPLPCWKSGGDGKALLGRHRRVFKRPFFLQTFVVFLPSLLMLKPPPTEVSSYRGKHEQPDCSKATVHLTPAAAK